MDDTEKDTGCAGKGMEERNLTKVIRVYFNDFDKYIDLKDFPGGVYGLSLMLEHSVSDLVKVKSSEGRDVVLNRRYVGIIEEVAY